MSSGELLLPIPADPFAETYSILAVMSPLAPCVTAPAEFNTTVPPVALIGAPTTMSPTVAVCRSTAYPMAFAASLVVMPDTEPTVPIVSAPELTRLNPVELTPAMAPEIAFVGSIKLTDPLGALADKAATVIVAGFVLLRACVMLPFAALSTSVPDAAVIGALMLMSWVAARVRLFEFVHATGAETVMVPPRGALALEEVVTVTFPSPNSFWRSDVDRFDDALLAVNVKGAVPDTLISLVESFELITMSLGSSNKVPADPCGALRSTVPVKSSLSALEVSTAPPSPLSAPPRAEIPPYI